MVELVHDLELGLAGAKNEFSRRLVRYLLEVAKGDGRLPRVGVRPVHSVAAIAVAAGITDSQIRKSSEPKRIIGSYAARFRLTDRSVKVVGNSLECRPETLMQRVRIYVEETIASGAPIPSMNGTISRRAVATALGVNVESMHCRAFEPILDAVRQGRIPLGEPYEHADMSRNLLESRARLRQLRTIAESFDVPGAKIPENPKRRGHIGWAHLSSLSGVTEPTMEGNGGYRRFVEDIAARRGLEIVGLAAGPGNVAATRRYVVETIASEMSARNAKNVDVVTGGVRKAFDRLAEAAGLEAEDDAAGLFGDAFEALSGKVLAAIVNKGTAGNVRRQLQRCRELYMRRAAAGELPATLSEALKQLVAARGISVAAVARSVGSTPRQLYSWMGGTGVTSSNVEVIQRLEAFFRLPSGVLTSMLGTTFAGSNLTAKATEEYRSLDAKTRSLLPHDAAFWTAARLRESIDSLAHLQPGSTDYGRYLQLAAQPENRLPPHERTDRLTKQYDALISYKTANATFPLLRTPSAQWRSPGSKTINMKSVDGLFRFAAAPRGDSVVSGLGIALDEQTLAWLSCPQIVLAYLAHRAGKFASMDWHGQARGIFYTMSDLSLAHLVASLLNPITGYITQCPELASDLKPIPAILPPQFDDLLAMFSTVGERPLLSEDEVTAARRDWKGHCYRAYQAVMQATHHLKDVAEPARDPFECIEGLIRSPTPLADFIGLTYDAERRWASEATAPQMHRLDLRNSTMLRLHPILGFRPKNMAALTYTGDDRGMLRKRDGAWEIEVSWREFKNHRECPMFGTKTKRNNFRITLDDDAGLYEILERYLYDIRPRYPDAASSQAAFLTCDGLPMNSTRYGQIFKTYAAKNLAYNPVKGTGFPGVRSACPYAIRHIRVTDTLKNGTSDNRVQEAAVAIQTGEQMIRDHYGSLVPDEVTTDSRRTFSVAVAAAAAANRRRT